MARGATPESIMSADQSVGRSADQSADHPGCRTRDSAGAAARHTERLVGEEREVRPMQVPPDSRSRATGRAGWWSLRTRWSPCRRRRRPARKRSSCSRTCRSPSSRRALPGSQVDLASRRSDRSSADLSQRMCGRSPPGRCVAVTAGWSTIPLPNRHRGGGVRYHRACTLRCGPRRPGGPGMMSHRTMVPCSPAKATRIRVMLMAIHHVCTVPHH